MTIRKRVSESASSSSEQQAIPKAWRHHEVHQGEFQLTCLSCSNSSSIPLNALKEEQGEPMLSGLSKTTTVVSLGSDTMLQWMLAIGTYFLIHRAMWGPDVALYEGVLVPVIAAVIVFGVVPLLGEALRALVGNRLPVYSYTCPECGGHAFFASNGKRVALPTEELTAQRDTRGPTKTDGKHEKEKEEHGTNSSSEKRSNPQPSVDTGVVESTPHLPTVKPMRLEIVEGHGRAIDGIQLKQLRDNLRNQFSDFHDRLILVLGDKNHVLQIVATAPDAVLPDKSSQVFPEKAILEYVDYAPSPKELRDAAKAYAAGITKYVDRGALIHRATQSASASEYIEIFASFLQGTDRWKHCFAFGSQPEH